MRIRHLLAAAGIALASVVVPAYAVAAAEEDHGAEMVEESPTVAAATDGEEAAAGEAEHSEEIGHAEHECIELLESGKKIDDCQEAPSLIMPELNELIFGGSAFLILLGVMSKFAYPAIKKGMDARTERIRNEIDEADRLKAEAAATLTQYQSSVADAKAEAARIVDEARAAADAVRADIIARAEAEANEIKAKGREDVEAGKARAITELQAQVGDLTIALAEKVVERSLDDATNRQLIDNYINNLGNN